MIELHDQCRSRGQFTADLYVEGIGTARAYTSGALLAFRETGWAECIVAGKHPEWPVIA